jgi:hypothetical protein
VSVIGGFSFDVLTVRLNLSERRFEKGPPSTDLVSLVLVRYLLFVRSFFPGGRECTDRFWDVEEARISDATEDIQECRATPNLPKLYERIHASFRRRNLRQLIFSTCLHCALV